MSTFTAAFTSHPANGTAEQHRVPWLVMQDKAGAPVTPPPAPAPTTATTGGTVAAGVYQVLVTYVNASGESLASAAGQVTTTGTTSTITVPSPPAATGITGWYAYVSQAGGTAASAKRQQAAGSPTAIGTPLTLTAPPISTGSPLPATTSGVYATFKPLTPDDTVSTFTTNDPAVVTKINGLIAGFAAEGITIVLTVP